MTPPGRDVHTAEYTAKQVGLFEFETNQDLFPDVGIFQTKVMTSAAGAEIVLSSDNPAPCNIPYIELFGTFVMNKPSTTRF